VQLDQYLHPEDKFLMELTHMEKPEIEKRKNWVCFITLETIITSVPT
jgi:hypothetical protein